MKKNKQRIAKVQYITQDSPHISHSDQALAMFDKGLEWVQLRMKDAEEKVIAKEAEKILKYAGQYQGLLILNDDVHLAKKIGVTAVHIGLNDMPADEARLLLGDEVIIGGTANTFEQIQQQVARGVDYIGVGPFRFTTTKKNLSPIVGAQGYATLLAQMVEAGIDLPLFAVGGIVINDVEALMEIGLKHFAISGDLLKSHLRGEALDKRLL